jgi:hypothetical protein
VVAFGLWVTAACTGGDSNRSNFDSRKWVVDGTRSCEARQYREAMVEDLVENRLRGGMRRSEVLKLLGPADAADNTRGRPGLAFGIATEGSDCFYLYVGFRSNGELVEWLSDR